ncbi:DASS family sodium-coupled anion symporter [Myxosarcina sp. GI1]|uniref:DASS family sodium-coupled anion symporter n=1 Tax=Myxosarcina sp. GI1 TaxID=1541065 RepID=UPI0009DF0346|nr:DASS family sodium-coupled anion symporter [Myxosarcina sp. GI1]
MLDGKEKSSQVSKAKLQSNYRFRDRQLIATLLPILLGAIIWFAPVPNNVDVRAWHLLAIFLATVSGFIIKPLPIGVVALIALVTCVTTNTLELESALSGFSSTTSWLTLSSFLIARGIIKTGLATRIAYWFTIAIGKNTLLLSYGLLATDLVLAPAIPSGNARAGGVIFPVVRSLASVYESEPSRGTANRIGTFLMQTGYQGTQITTAMFLTAMVANPFMAEFAGEMGIKLDWMTWAVAASVPGGISLAIMPLVVYFCSPPEIKQTPEAASLARTKLTEMGRVKLSEWSMMAILVFLLSLWTFGSKWLAIESATTAILGVMLLLLAGVLTWDDVVSERQAWDIFIWFSILLMLATNLYRLNLIVWATQSLANAIDNLPGQLAFVLLSLVSFYSNYFFASKAAFTSAMYPALLPIALSFGTPPFYAALILACSMNLSGCLTHYATAEAPIYYGAGYIKAATWCRVGLILSLIYLPVWLVIGGIWWRVLGLF